MAKTGWDRSLGTSKREQGIITPKAPRRKSCGCEFRGIELFRVNWRCETHNMAVKLVTPEPVAEATTTKPEAPTMDFDPTMRVVEEAPKEPVVATQPVEQAAAQPAQQPQPYQGFVERVNTAEDVSVALS